MGCESALSEPPEVVERTASIEAGPAVARPMRVLHVIDSGGLYGAEQVVLELASEHRKLGHEPVIASIGVPESGEKPLERAARERGLPLRPVRMRAGPSLRGALQLVRLAREERADILHTHGYKANILLGMLPKALRPAPLITTVHGYTDLGGMSRLVLYHRVDRMALRRADRVVLVHAGMVTRAGLNRLRESRRRVIENGIPPVVVASSRSSEALPLDDEIARFCTGRAMIIGAIGRLSREKGFDILLRAVADVARNREDVALVILGEGRQRVTLERLAQELGLDGRLLMPGYVANARDYFRLFDLFALPSLTEGLPIVLLEAMQAGVPIVATRVGGVPHVLDHGCGGLLAEPGDAGGFASIIRRCLEDPDATSRLAAHARAIQATRFSSKAMARRYSDLYRETLGT